MERIRVRGVAAAIVTSAVLAFAVGEGVSAEASRSAPSEAGSTLVRPVQTLLASGLRGASGSTVGPDGALYVTEGASGTITRIDPRTGAAGLFASGLPPAVLPIGGAVDLAFVGKTLYVAVTLVAEDVGGTAKAGLYRMRGPDQFELVADIGAWAVANPPTTPFDLPTGVLYAMQLHDRAFLITDGHHNRVLRVTLDGRIGVAAQFGNVVPTGLAAWRDWVILGLAGPVPHLPADGKAVVLSPRWLQGVEVAAGARLLVDVEFGPYHRLFALSQGEFRVGDPPGAPALPGTGALLVRAWNGQFVPIVEQLNLPTSLEFIGGKAFVVTLGGEVWRIDLAHAQ